jgi:hypothetical protein
LQCDHGRHFDNIIGSGSARQVGHGPGQSLKNRANGRGAPQPLGQLVSDVAGVEIGKDEYVRPSAQGRAGRLPLTDFRVERGVGLKLTIRGNVVIPWNYARFLNYSTERLFLQRVGGRYRFVHKLIQEHFAKMTID